MRLKPNLFYQCMLEDTGGHCFGSFHEGVQHRGASHIDEILARTTAVLIYLIFRDQF